MVLRRVIQVAVCPCALRSTRVRGTAAICSMRRVANLVLYARPQPGGHMALDALKGWSSAQKHVVAASYLGWTLDAFDFLLITLVAKDIATEFNTNAKTLGVIITATLVMRPLGAFIFGRLADRAGRRPILMLNV